MDAVSERTPDTSAPDREETGLLLSAREAAISLGVNERTIRRAIANGLLPATKRGGVWEIHARDLAAWPPKRRSPEPRAFISPALSIVPSAPPFRVPTPRTPLFGRDHELQEIVRRMLDPGCALVTLIGPGGSGKTRLALAAATAMEGRFADGIWFVDCSPLRDARFVLPSIVSTLDLNEVAGKTPDERLRTWLASKHLLLILDNLEHLVPAAVDLARLLGACPGLTVLATSRVALRVSMEQQIPVLPLALPTVSQADDLASTLASPAVQLFVWRIQTFTPSFALTAANVEVVGDICHRLDGLPLAIELAAAHTRVLSLPDLRGRLRKRLSLLADGPADQPDRLRSLRHAIAWSYDLLDPTLQRTFRTLSVFAGGFTLEAASWVLGSTPEDALRALTALQDHNLIVPMPSGQTAPRFTMLETIREFAAERLEATSDLAAVRHAHADWCLDLSERVFPHWFTPAQTEWDDRITEEYDNIRTALVHLADRDDTSAGIALVARIWPFWFVRNHFTEGLSWLRRAHDWSAGQSTPERVQLLIGKSALSLQIDDKANARRHADEAMAIYTDLGMDDAAYNPLNALAVVAASLGEADESRRLNDAALAMFRSHAAHSPMAHTMVSIVLSNMAWNAFSHDHIEEAESLATEALQIQQAIQYDWGLVVTYFLLALLAERRGDAEKATALLSESLAHVLADRDLNQATDVFHQCTLLLSAMNDHERVALLIGAVDALRERTGIPLAPSAVSERIPWCDLARSHLGELDYERLYRAGRTSTLDAMIDIAQAAEVRPAHVHGTAHAAWSLTPREVDVLDLLMQGLTDQEIADHLYVSRRTINTHVANILAKMNVPNRRRAIQQARAVHGSEQNAS